MIASVIPLIRMPRGMDVYDYAIPEDMITHVEPGHLVVIPFRSKTQFGVVLSIRPRPTDKTFAHELKAVERVVQTVPIVSKRHMHTWRILAGWYGVSLGVIAKMSLLPLQKRKLTTLALSHIEQNDTRPYVSDPTFHCYHDETVHKETLLKAIKEDKSQTLILVPTIDLIESVRPFFSAERTDVVVWHSELSVKEQFDAWRSIRNNEVSIIIGTRGASLIPFFNLKTIIIDYEYHREHKHSDQAPRFHVKDVVMLLSRVFGARVISMGYSPSVDTFSTCSISQAAEPMLANPVNASILDMRSQRGAGDFSAFSPTIQHCILNATQDIVIILNRRGFARSFTCTACGYVNTCDHCGLPYIYHEKENKLRCHYCKSFGAIDLCCPTCGSTMMKLRGIGIEFLENEAKKIAPKSHTVILVDSESPIPKGTGPRILVGTESALSFARWNNTEAVILPDLDRDLSLPEYTVEEQLYHLVQSIDFHKRSECPLYIQTVNPDHRFFSFLVNPALFYKTTVKERAALLYPPSRMLVRYMVGSPFVYEAKRQADTLHRQLGTILTNTKKTITLSSPIEMHPRFYRGKHWYVILVRLMPDTWMNELLSLNKFVPAGWRVDPRPGSILSL